MIGPCREHPIDHPVLYPTITGVHERAVEGCILPNLPSKPFRKANSASCDGLMPVIQEQLMQIDLHRTYFSAVAAKRRGETEVLPLIKILHVWRYHTTDRSTVRGSVSMSADVFVDRTCIQASTAADAVKAFTLLGVGENIRSAVVKQNDIHLFRTIRLVWLARTAYDRIVHGDLLTCPES